MSKLPLFLNSCVFVFFLTGRERERGGERERDKEKAPDRKIKEKESAGGREEE